MNNIWSNIWCMALLWTHCGSRSAAPSDPRLHLRSLQHVERPTSFHYHFPKSIRTAPTFDFLFKPWISYGKKTLECWIVFTVAALFTMSIFYYVLLRLKTILKIITRGTVKVNHCKLIWKYTRKKCWVFRDYCQLKRQTLKSVARITKVLLISSLNFCNFCNACRVLIRNFGKMTFLRHLGKSVKLKTYPRTVRCVKRSWGSGFFCLGFFVLKRSLWTPTLGPFPCAKTTYKLLWNSKNVTNITEALNMRQNIKQKTYLDLIGKFDSVGKMTLYGICEGCLNSC